MSDFFPLSIEADRIRPITPEYGLLRGECWTTVPLPPPTDSCLTFSPRDHLAKITTFYVLVPANLCTAATAAILFGFSAGHVCLDLWTAQHRYGFPCL